MRDRPTISCVIPVFNGERFIREAIQSVLQQTYPPREVIVVDDGSTDDTRAAVREFGAAVSYHYQPNRGPAGARNAGIAASCGDFLSFLDADDLWHREKLERQLTRFEARTDLELSLTYQRPFWVPEMQAEGERLHRLDHPFAKDHPGYICQTMLMPRSVFENVGLFDEDLTTGEDTDWLTRANDKAVVREILEDVLVYRRLHQDNLSYSCHSERGTDARMTLVFAHLKRLRAAAR